jgi:Cysteine-rich secretory protein family
MLCLALAAPMAHAAQAESTAPGAAPPDLLNEAEDLFELANQARAAAGVKPLSWDPALTDAALAHCRLMAEKGPIAHQYAGELDLQTRAAKAGAHFSLIAENVAIGASPEEIQHGWMNSPGHRANLLNPDVNRLGVAVVQARGVLYAVEDFSQAVPVLTHRQVEIVVSRLVAARGITILADNKAARTYCATGNAPPDGRAPSLMISWQGSNLTALPSSLASPLASGHYHQAEVGSCAPQGVKESFTAFRVAVLLY